MPNKKQIEAFQAKYREISERCNWGHSWPSDEAVSELLTAALPEQEPMAWLWENPKYGKELMFNEARDTLDARGWTSLPLYLASPIARPLPDEEVERLKAERDELQSAFDNRTDKLLEMAEQMGLLKADLKLAEAEIEKLKVQRGEASERSRSALKLAEGRLSLLLEAYPEDSDKIDHPIATRYVIKKVRSALSSHVAGDDEPKPCTCHPDDSPPVPCPQKYAYSECVFTASLSDRSGSGDAVRVTVPRGGIEPNWWEEWVKMTRAYNALAKAAQAVIDETAKIHDNEPSPVRYRAPYGSITKLISVLSETDRRSALQSDRAGSGDAVRVTEVDMLRSALQAAVDTIQDYLAYEHDGDPRKEDSRAMGEMDINDYGKDGRLDYALSLLTTDSDRPDTGVTYSQAEFDEAYEIGKRDGYSDAEHDIDQRTGGDGEYRYCLGMEEDIRHVPDPATMIQRIVDRFEVMNLLDEATKSGSDEPDDRPDTGKEGE